jgi:O-antigen ligase
MGRDHPWLGVGLDNFLYHYRERYVKRDVVQDGSLNHPHNWVLDWWTRLGLPGLAILGVLVLGNLWLGLRAVGRSPPAPPGAPAPDRALAVAALGMQVYALAAGLVDNSFFLIDLAAVWWIGQAGLIAIAGRPDGSIAAERAPSANAPPPPDQSA